MINEKDRDSLIAYRLKQSEETIEFVNEIKRLI